MEILEYQTSSGKVPFREWLLSLKGLHTRARIRARIDRLQLGNFGDCKSLGQGLIELRLHFGAGYRLYIGREGQRAIILLCGGDKGSQPSDIQRAGLLARLLEEVTMKPSRSYHQDLVEDLKDPAEAQAYLNAALEDGDEKAFLLALRNVVEAQGGVSKFSRHAKLHRVSLYRMLSRRGNPEWDSVIALLNALGVRFHILEKTAPLHRRAA